MEGNALPLVLQLLVNNKNVQKDIVDGIGSTPIPPIKTTLEITPEIAQALAALVDLERAFQKVTGEISKAESELTALEKKSANTAKALGKHGDSISQAVASGGEAAGTKVLEDILKRLKASTQAPDRSSRRRARVEARIYKYIDETLTKRLEALTDIQDGEEWQERRERVEGKDGFGGLLKRRADAGRRRRRAQARLRILQGLESPLDITEEEFNKDIGELENIIKKAKDSRPGDAARKKIRAKIIELSKKRSANINQMHAAEDQLPGMLDQARDLETRIGSMEQGGPAHGRMNKFRRQWDATADVPLRTKTAQKFVSQHLSTLTDEGGLDDALSALASQKRIPEDDRATIEGIIQSRREMLPEAQQHLQNITKHNEELEKLKAQHAKLLARIQQLRNQDNSALKAENKELEKQIQILRQELRGEGADEAEAAARRIISLRSRRSATRDIAETHGQEVVDHLKTIGTRNQAVEAVRKALQNLPAGDSSTRRILQTQLGILEGSSDPLELTDEEYTAQRDVLREQIREGRRSRPGQDTRKSARAQILSAQERLREIEPKEQAATKRLQTLQEDARHLRTSIPAVLLTAEDPRAELARQMAEVDADLSKDNLSERARKELEGQRQQMDSTQKALQEYLTITSEIGELEQQIIPNLQKQAEAARSDLTRARQRFRGGSTVGVTAVGQLIDLATRHTATRGIIEDYGKDSLLQRPTSSHNKDIKELRKRLRKLDAEIEAQNEIIQDVRDNLDIGIGSEVAEEELADMLEERDEMVKERKALRSQLKKQSREMRQTGSATGISELQTTLATAQSRLKNLTDEKAIRKHHEGSRLRALLYTREMSTADIETDLTRREGRISSLTEQIEAAGTDEEKVRLELEKRQAEHFAGEIRTILAMRKEVEGTISGVERQLNELVKGDSPEARVAQAILAAQKEERAATEQREKVEREIRAETHHWTSTAEALTTEDPAKLQGKIDPELQKELNAYAKRRQNIDNQLREVSEEMAQLERLGDERTPEQEERYEALQIRRVDLSEEAEQLRAGRGEFIERTLGFHGVGKEATEIIEGLTGGRGEDGFHREGKIERGRRWMERLDRELYVINERMRHATDPEERLALERERATKTRRRAALEQLTSEREQFITDITGALTTTDTKKLPEVLEHIRSRAGMGDVSDIDPKTIEAQGRQLIQDQARAQTLREQLDSFGVQKDALPLQVLELTSALEQMGLQAGDIGNLLNIAMQIPEGTPMNEFQKVLQEGKPPVVPPDTFHTMRTAFGDSVPMRGTTFRGDPMAFVYGRVPQGNIVPMGGAGLPTMPVTYGSELSPKVPGLPSSVPTPALPPSTPSGEWAGQTIQVNLDVSHLIEQWDVLTKEWEKQPLRMDLDVAHLVDQWTTLTEEMVRDPLRVRIESEVTPMTSMGTDVRKAVISEVVTATTSKAAETTARQVIQGTASKQAAKDTAKTTAKEVASAVGSATEDVTKKSNKDADREAKRRAREEERARQRDFRESLKHESELFRQDFREDPVEALRQLGWHKEAGRMYTARSADLRADPEASRHYTDLYRMIVERGGTLGQEPTDELLRKFIDVITGEIKKWSQGARRIEERRDNQARSAALASDPTWKAQQLEDARARREARDELNQQLAEERRQAWLAGPYQQIQEQLTGFQNMRTSMGITRNPYDDRERTYRNVLSAHQRWESDLVRLAGVTDEDERIKLETKLVERQRALTHAEDMYRMARVADREFVIPRLESAVVMDAQGQPTLRARPAMAPRWDERRVAMDTSQAKAYWDEALKDVSNAERPRRVRELTEAIKLGLREAHTSGEAVDFQGNRQVLAAYRGVARKLGMEISDTGEVSMAPRGRRITDRVDGATAYRQSSMYLEQELGPQLRAMNAQVRERRRELENLGDPASLAELNRTREITFDEFLTSTFDNKLPQGMTKYQRELLKGVKIERDMVGELRKHHQLRQRIINIVREESRLEDLARRHQVMLRERREARSNNPYRHAIRAASYQLGLYSAGFMAAYQVRAAMGRHMEFEQTMAGIQGVLQTQSPEDRARLQTTIAQVSLQYGADLLETAQAARILAQSGLTLSETMEELDVTMLAMRGLEMTIEQMQELQIAIKAITGEVGNSAAVLEKISNVEKQFAITAQDIADALKVFSPVAAQFTEGMFGIGDAFDYTIAMATVMVEQLRITGKQAGDSLKFIFARLLAPDISRNLQEIYGVRMARNEDGTKMLSLPDMLDEIYFQYQSYMMRGEEAMATRMLAQLSGGRRVNQVLALFNQYDRVMEIASISSYAFGDAQERASISMDTLYSSVQRLRTGFQLFVSGVMETSGAANVLRASVDGLTSALTLASQTGNTLPMLGLMVAGLGGITQATKFGVRYAGLAQDAMVLSQQSGERVTPGDLLEYERRQRAMRLSPGVDIARERGRAGAARGVGVVGVAGRAGRGALAASTRVLGVFGTMGLAAVTLITVLDLVIKAFQHFSGNLERETVRLQKHTAESLDLINAPHFRGYTSLAEELGYGGDPGALYEDTIKQFILNPMEDAEHPLRELMRGYNEAAQGWGDVAKVLRPLAPDTTGMTDEEVEAARESWLASREAWEGFSKNFHDTLMKNIDQFGSLGEALAGIANEEERRIALSKAVEYAAWNRNVILASSIQDAQVMAQQLFDSMGENLDRLNRQVRIRAGTSGDRFTTEQARQAYMDAQLAMQVTSVFESIFRTSMFEDKGRAMAHAFMEYIDADEVFKEARDLARARGLTAPTEAMIANVAFRRLEEDENAYESFKQFFIQQLTQQSDVRNILAEAGLATDAIQDEADPTVFRNRLRKFTSEVLEGFNEVITDEAQRQVLADAVRNLAESMKGAERFRLNVDTTAEALLRLKNVLLEITLSFYQAMRQIDAETSFSRMLGTEYNPNQARIQAARQMSIGIRTIDDEYATQLVRLADRRRNLRELLDKETEKLGIEAGVVDTQLERMWESQEVDADFQQIRGVDRLMNYMEEYNKISGEMAGYREQYQTLITDATQLLDLIPEGDGDDVISPQVRQYLEQAIARFNAGGEVDTRLVTTLQALADNVAIHYNNLEQDLQDVYLQLEHTLQDTTKRAELRRQEATFLGSREEQFSATQAAAELEYLARREQLQGQYQAALDKGHIKNAREHNNALENLDKEYEREKRHREALFDLETRRIRMQTENRRLQESVTRAQALHDLAVAQIRAEVGITEQILRRESAAKRLLQTQIEAIESNSELLRHQKDDQIEQLILDAERTQYFERQNLLIQSQNALLDQGRTNLNQALSGFRTGVTNLDIWKPLRDDKALDQLMDSFEGIDSHLQARIKVIKDNLLTMLRPVVDTLYGRIVDNFVENAVDALMETRIREMAIFSEMRLQTAVQEAELMANGIQRGGFVAGDYIRTSIESAGISLGMQLSSVGSVDSGMFSRARTTAASAGAFLDEQERIREAQTRAAQLRTAQMKEAAGMMAGTALGSIAGGGGGWAQMGSTAGALMGTFIPGVGNVVGSVLGGIAGGILGGIFDDDERDASTNQAERLEAIERAQRDTISVIEDQTDVLLDLENRFINLPSTFDVPNYFGGFGSFSGGGVGLPPLGGYEVPPPSVSHDNRSFNITVNAPGGDAQEISQAVEQAVERALGTTLSRQRNTRGRGRSRF